MKGSSGAWTWVVAGIALAAAVAVSVFGCNTPDAAPAGVPKRGEASYMPAIEPPFAKVFAELSREKPLALGTRLSEDEKRDLLVYLYSL